MNYVPNVIPLETIYNEFPYGLNLENGQYTLNTCDNSRLTSQVHWFKAFVRAQGPTFSAKLTLTVDDVLKLSYNANPDAKRIFLYDVNAPPNIENDNLSSYYARLTLLGVRWYASQRETAKNK